MICVVGGKGSIGSRYVAILKYHNIPHVIFDMFDDFDLLSFDKFIIATPTETHAHFLNRLKGATILCEKPVSKNPTEIPKDEKMFVVNNYAYVARLMKQNPPYLIDYDYYRTGKDGLLWDCCQLIHMDNDAKLNKTSPKWNCSINGHPVPFRTLEESYVRMILDFNDNQFKNLWTMKDGLEMTLEVLERAIT